MRDRSCCRTYTLAAAMIPSLPLLRSIYDGTSVPLLIPLSNAVDDLITEPLHLQPPFATIPTGPGLGVELDRDAIRHYQTDRREYSA